jgi:hypothetical protein
MAEHNREVKRIEKRKKIMNNLMKMVSRITMDEEELEAEKGDNKKEEDKDGEKN